jgi:hypothetical protein
LFNLVLGGLSPRNEPGRFALAIRGASFHDANKPADAIDLLTVGIAKLLETLDALRARCTGLLKFILNPLEQAIKFLIDLEK